MQQSSWTDLLREGVITQAVLTLLVVGGTIAMVVAGRTVPDDLWAFNGLVIGFYFGGKVQAQVARIARQGKDERDAQVQRRAQCLQYCAPPCPRLEAARRRGQWLRHRPPPRPRLEVARRRGQWLRHCPPPRPRLEAACRRAPGR